MAISSEANGSQTATLTTEHTLTTITTAGAYQLHVDANALTDDEELTLRARVKVLTGSSSLDVWEHTIRANDGLDHANLVSPVMAITNELIFTLEQNNGTGRAFPWEVVDLGNTSVAETASGTSAAGDRTPGSEHTLATRTDGKTYVLYVDLSAATVTEEVELRLKHKIRSVGTTRKLWSLGCRGDVADGTPVAMSPPIPALHELVATLEETGGTERSYEWALVSLD